MKTPVPYSPGAKSPTIGRASTPQHWAIAVAAFAGLSVTPFVQAQISGPFNALDYTLNSNTTAAGFGRPTITGGELLLTTNQNDNTVSAFYNTAQSVTNWTAQFTYTPGAASSPPADGFAFVIQDSGLGALGGGGGALGFLGITDAVASAFDVYNGGNNTRSGISTSGLNTFYYQETSPVNLRASAVTINLAFRDGVLTQSFTQGVTTATRSFNINIADRVGSTGFVGFSAATGGLNIDQKISNFTFTPGNAPAVAPAAQVLTGVPQGGPGFFGIREVQGAPSCCGNLNETQTAILGSHPNRIDYTAPVLNLFDSDTRGRFNGDSLYKLDTDQVTPDNNTIDNVAVVATGRIRIPVSDVYTFGSNSDDGFRLTIGGQRFEAAFGQGGTTINANGALEFPNGRGGGESSLGTIYLAAGDYDIQMLNWEGGGGASVELYSSRGAKTAFDAATFTLIGGANIPERNGKNKVVNVAQWTLKEYTGVNNVSQVITNAQTNTGTLRGSSTVPTIRYNDPQGANNGGHDADAAAFPFDAAGVGDDNYGAFASTTLTIDPADVGRYTFMMYTDDDSRFRILNSLGVPVPLAGLTVGDVFDSDGVNGPDQFGTAGCCFDQFGHYDLAAGTYTIEAAFHEGSGGSGFFIYATQGDAVAFNAANFQLLGANVDGANWTVPGADALQLVPEPTGVSLLGFAAVGLMARRRRQRA